jgi:hypothetical protein
MRSISAGILDARNHLELPTAAPATLDLDPVKRDERSQTRVSAAASTSC